MQIDRLLIVSATAALLAACGTMGPMSGAAPARVSGGALTNDAGMTLYTFDKDAAGSGKSACNGPCATNWPPLLAAADARGTGDYTLVGRDDGKKQWAYKGKPLYTWIKDSKPGDMTGDGVNNAWRTARP